MIEIKNYQCVKGDEFANLPFTHLRSGIKIITSID
jgi:hypothetical protein